MIRLYDNEDDDPLPSALEQLAAPGPDALQQMQAADLLWRCWDSLDPVEQQLLWLIYVEEHSYGEIIDDLGLVSREAAQVRAFRARDKLRGCLGRLDSVQVEEVGNG